jgi:hypothetical protein
MAAKRARQRPVAGSRGLVCAGQTAPPVTAKAELDIIGSNLTDRGGRGLQTIFSRRTANGRRRGVQPEPGWTSRSKSREDARQASTPPRQGGGIRARVPAELGDGVCGWDSTAGERWRVRVRSSRTGGARDTPGPYAFGDFFLLGLQRTLCLEGASF